MRFLLISSIEGIAMITDLETGQNGDLIDNINQYMVALISSIDPDSQGNLYLTGSCSGTEDIYFAGIGHETITFDTVSYTGQSFYYPFLVKLDAGIITVIEEQRSFSDIISLYPNPTRDFLNIPMKPSQIQQVAFYDILGSRVKSVSQEL